MSLTIDAPAPIAAPAGARVWPTYRFELVKLLAQWRIRLVFLACWIAPAVLGAAISQQSSLPADTVFGRWMSQTGWAGPLVVLSFSSNWVLPLLTSLVAGDVFASEDRLGTWRHLLVTVRSPRRIFVVKALASLSVIGLLVAELAASGVVGGLAAAGNRPLVGLDGQLLAPGDAAGAVLLAWAGALVVGALPVAGLAAVSIGALAVTTPSTGPGITQDKLQSSLATTFGHLYVRQTVSSIDRLPPRRSCGRPRRASRATTASVVKPPWATTGAAWSRGMSPTSM